jgi:ribosomal protein L37E
MKYKIICENCGKEGFNNRKKGKYCSKQCSNNAQKGSKRPHSKEWEEKRVKAVIESSKNRIYEKGYKRPIEYIRPMQNALEIRRKANPGKYREISIKNLPQTLSGENSPNWRGGRTEMIRGLRLTNRYKKWRKSVLERNDHKCVDCGSGKNIEVHHIIPICENDEFIIEPANGITLCHECHKRIKSARRKPKDRRNPLIIIETIPHRWQEYGTAGNWKFSERGTLLIFVSDMKNDDYAFLVGIHEAVEAWLCRKRRIDERKVTDFDLNFEANRKEGDDSEPGDDPNAPYENEHLFATGIEKLLCSEFCVKWSEYDKTVNNL